MKSFITCLHEWMSVVLLDVFIYESDFWDILQSESQHFSSLAWILDGWLLNFTHNDYKVFWFRLNQINHPY